MKRGKADRWGVFVVAACVAGLGGLLGAPAVAQEQGDAPQQDATPENPAVPIRPRPPGPGGMPAPEAIRRRIDGIRGPKTNTSRDATGTPAEATPSPTSAPASGASGATGGGAGSSGAGTSRPSGSGVIETAPRNTKPIPWNAKITLPELDDADLENVIKEISRATRRNFIYDKQDIRNKKVTLLLPTQLTVAEAYQAFQTALEAAGLTVYQPGPSLYRILPRRDVKEKPIDTEAGKNVGFNDSFVTRIIRLQNIDVGQIQSIIQALVAKDGQLQAFAPTNSLIITDTANNIRRLVTIIDELDRSGGEEAIEVIKVRNADVGDVADKIQQLFGVTAAAAPGAPGRPAPAGRRAGAVKRDASQPHTVPTPGPDGATPSAPGESAPLLSKVIADDRTNQLIVQGNDRAIAAVREFLEVIDVPGDGAGGIHVYYLENADAEELAGVLSNLAQGVASNGTSGRRRNEATPAAPGQPAAPAAGGAVAVLQGDVKITADKATNALVITASKSDFDALKEVIRKLDIRRQQVYVEAVIMEITVNKSRDLGLSFGGAADAGDGAIGFGGLNAANALFINPTQLATGFALGLIGPGGVTLSVPNPTGGTTDVTVPPFGVVLNALQSDSDINVLSRPNVLAKENEEAEIVVATSVAVPGNVTISQTGLQNFSITHEDVGITLRVTPKINESEYISMQLFQEVKDIVNDTTTASGQRLVDTGKRSAKTNVVVKNGETIVIGGLLSDTDRRNEQKVPLLGDIPFLGWLFRNSGRRATKQNLLIFLTPTIINDDRDMRMIYERRIKEREEFLRLYASRQARKEDKKRQTVYDRFYGAGEPEPKQEPAVPARFEPVNRPADAPPPQETPAPAPDKTPEPEPATGSGEGGPQMTEGPGPSAPGAP